MVSNLGRKTNNGLIPVILCGMAVIIIIRTWDWTSICANHSRESDKNNRISDAEIPRINDVETSQTNDAKKSRTGSAEIPRDKGGRPQIYDYKAAMAELNREKVAQDDPRLIQIIRDHYIIPPSTENYDLQRPLSTKDFSADKVSTIIDRKLFNNTNKGFFIECGAFDGEYKSTTLYFELEKKWEGLLVEADPISFARLRYKNRKAYIMHACLSTSSYPSVIEFSVMGETGRVLDAAATSYRTKFKPKNIIKVQCFPLYSILLALNQLTVDFFSLDVEGAELDVLKTLPLDKVHIGAMLVEYYYINGQLRALEPFLHQNGFENVRKEIYDVLVKKKASAP